MFAVIILQFKQRGLSIRVGTSIIQPVNSSGKCQHSKYSKNLLKWQILAFLNKIKLKTCEIKNLLLYFAKHDAGINHKINILRIHVCNNKPWGLMLLCILIDEKWRQQF